MGMNRCTKLLGAGAIHQPFMLKGTDIWILNHLKRMLGMIVHRHCRLDWKKSKAKPEKERKMSDMNGKGSEGGEEKRGREEE